MKSTELSRSINDLGVKLDIVCDKFDKKINYLDIRTTKLETNYSWVKWIIGGNVTLWVVVLGLLLRVLSVTGG